MMKGIVQKLTSGSTNYTATVYDEAYYACGGS